MPCAAAQIAVIHAGGLTAMLKLLAAEVSAPAGSRAGARATVIALGRLGGAPCLVRLLQHQQGVVVAAAAAQLAAAAMRGDAGAERVANAGGIQVGLLLVNVCGCHRIHHVWCLDQ